MPDSGRPAPLVVETTEGKVEGIATAGGRAWLGIPFAAPPVGPLRFRAPEPSAPWSDVRPCKSLGQPAIQMTLPGARPEGPVVGSEDCLTLNVWTPDALAASRPVLVWVHGGGFVRGSGTFHDGAALAARTGSIVITFNYRLGPLGFLHLADLPGAAARSSTNPALLDIVAALRFVSANAAAFGGDPGNITVFGESAGAMLIGALLGAPAAEGLFARAVLLSGASVNVHPRATANEVTEFFLEVAGIPEGEVERLWALSPGEIRAAAAATNDASVNRPWDAEAFLPCIDGLVLPRPPMAAIAAGAASGVDLLISVCRDEMNLFLANSPALCRGKEVFRRHGLGDTAWERLEARYRELLPSPEEARRDLLTDSMFSIPAIRLAEAHGAAGGRSWMMRLDSDLVLSPFDRLGPCHGHDVCLVWEHYSFGQGSIETHGTDRDRAAARALQEVIATFARTGTPAAPGLWWPAYGEERSTLLLGSAPRVEADPIAARRRAWDGLPV